MPRTPKTPKTPSVPAGYRRLEGSERKARKGARRLGPADPKEPLLVSVYVRRRPDAPPLPDQAHWAVTPPGRRTFLTREEFAQRYGASPDDLKIVADFAQSHGLKVVETGTARRLVQLSGTVEQVTKAFAVRLDRYEWGKETYRGREGHIYIPAELADVVEGVFGLDNRPVVHHRVRGAVELPAAGPAGASPLSPPQVAQLYNFPSGSATGQTIGILEFGGGYAVADIQSFYTGLGLTAPVLTDVGVDTATNTPAGSLTNFTIQDPDVEVALDIDVAGSVAPGAKIAVYFAPNSEQGFADAITTAVNDTTNAPSVISISWAGSEDGWSSGGRNKISTALQDAASMGLTVVVSSGDDGSDCGVGDGNAHVEYPASDPWATGCGGTYISNVSGSNFTQGTWNDAGATGGGVSDVFPVPAWQAGANVPKSANQGGGTGRGVPDVAGNASPYSGYTPWLYGKQTTSLKITSGAGAGNTYGTVGGTSAVAPLYAGLIAILNAKLGQSVGYLNPTLYALAEDPSTSGVFEDINDGTNNEWASEAQATPSYASGAGWDACTGWGVIDGGALLAQLQATYAKSITFVLDRDHYGQDEIDALRTQPGGAVVKGAFFVVVDGFTPKKLGITDSTSLGVAPVVNFSPSTGLVNPAACTSLESDDPSFGPEIQRFRFGYDVNFGPDDSAFTSFSASSETVTLGTIYQGISASAQIQLIKQPDPYILQGPQTWWLSNDVRLIQVKEGGSAFGMPFPTGGDPLAYLSSLTSALEAGQGIVNGVSFDSNTQEDAEELTVAPTDAAGNKVYNLAIARVHYQALSNKAQSVRVYFRLFAANSTATNFDPNSTYRRYGKMSSAYPVPPPDYFQEALPELGLSAGEYVTVPCFGEARQDATQSGPADTLPSLQAPDAPNVKDLQATGGPVHDSFYGAWLDINQVTAALPAVPISGNEDGPWPGLTLQSVRDAFIVNDHTCVVAEIAFDPVAISTGTAPFNSDKLAQRNISWSYVANPGEEASRRALEPFEVRPTPAKLAQGERPDELMIDWNNVPTGQTAEIYLPAVDADVVIAKATELYRVERLTRVDAHTIGCATGGVSYIPLPQGSGDGANFTGLISVNLPLGIHKGQEYKVLVRQLTNASGRGTPPPPPPPQIARKKAAVVVTHEPNIPWRRVLGTFQVNIPVRTKEQILPREERRLSIFRWIGDAMAPQRRWYPVFQRYLELIAQRVKALGGDPTKILPSPTGDGGRKHRPHEGGEECRAYTGKIAGLIFDRFGDFEGFLLDTEDGEQKFLSREKDVEQLAERVWRDRLRITVWVEQDEPHRPLTLIVREPPALFGH